ncbi:MAG: hypothetical protein RR444_12120 [Oscillospiraceae bacterium]
MSKKKIKEPVVALIVCGIVLAALCIANAITPYYLALLPVDDELKEKMIDAIDENGILRVADATDFEWDEMWAKPADAISFGMADQYFTEETGIPMPEYRVDAIDYGYEIFFMKNKEFVMNGGDGIDFSGFSPNVYARNKDGEPIKWVLKFTPKTAIFRTKICKHDYDNEIYLTLYPVEEIHGREVD